MKKRNILALTLSILLTISCLAGCGTKNPTPGSPGNAASGTRTVVGRVSDIFGSLNPYDSSAYSDAYIFNHVYETLFRLDNNGNPNPVLATGYSVSDDAMTYTIEIVKNAVFHDGTPLKASDVVFTYEFAKQYTARASYCKMVESVTAIDDYTLEFKLNAVDPLFIAYTSEMFILSEKFVTENNGEITNKVCGTGPYTMVSFDPAVNCVLTANEDYRLGAAKVKDLEIRYVGDDSSALVSFEAGAIDVMSIPSAMVESIKSNPKFDTQNSTPKHTAIIALNTTVAPLDNKLVRQALSYAANKEAMVEVAYEGLAVVARLQAGLNSFGVDFSDSPDISYNPEKAKELLAQAGYPNGINFTELGIHMDVIAGGYHEKIAQVFQQNLSDIGCQIELVSTEIPDEKADTGDFVIMNEGLSYRADFSYNKMQYTTGGSTNWSQMSDPYVDEMFAKGDVETDPNVRKDIYRELIAYLVDYCPSIPIFHKSSCYGWNAELEGVQIYDDSARPWFAYEWSWK